METTTRRDVRLDDLGKGLTPLFATSLYPEQVYPQLRQEWGSVAPVELDGGIPAWLVLDWEDCLRVVREEHVFSRNVEHWTPFWDGRVQPGTPLHAFFMPRRNAYYTDGRDQERLREVVDGAFASIDEFGFAAQVRQACDRMLARIVRDGATETDLVATYTTFVPALAVAAMYGVGAEQALQLGHYAKDIFSNTPAAGPAFVGINALLSELIRERDARPGRDALSYIVHWRDPHTGLRLTPEEMLDTAQMIQSAGHEMAVAWTTTSLVHLLADGAFAGRVRGGRLGVDEALDAVLVHASPVGNTPARFVTADVEIGGRMVHKGEAITAAVGRATADAHVGSDPIWDSTSRASLAWGSGPHRCPADRVSRIIVKAAVEAVLIRLPGLKLAASPAELGVGISLWSLRADKLPVTFDPVTQYDENWNNLIPVWA